MRAYDRDLIRGGHYGQRSCEPHSKAEHMAAPTKSCDVKKVLANSEPSTHGTTRLNGFIRNRSACWGEADCPFVHLRRRVSTNPYFEIGTALLTYCGLMPPLRHGMTPCT